MVIGSDTAGHASKHSLQPIQACISCLTCDRVLSKIMGLGLSNRSIQYLISLTLLFYFVTIQIPSERQWLVPALGCWGERAIRSGTSHCPYVIPHSLLSIYSISRSFPVGAGPRTAVTAKACCHRFACN